MTPRLRMVAQRHDADCGVAALAMLLGVSYEDALIALGGEVPKILKRGVWFTEMQRAAQTLGATLKLKRRWHADEDDGIAQVKFPKGNHHVVVVRDGLIFDTDLTVWEPDDYFKATKTVPGALLIREGE